jgi:hypothetical protein
MPRACGVWIGSVPYLNCALRSAGLTNSAILAAATASQAAANEPGEPAATFLGR